MSNHEQPRDAGSIKGRIESLLVRILRLAERTLPIPMLMLFLLPLAIMWGTLEWLRFGVLSRYARPRREMMRKFAKDHRYRALHDWANQVWMCLGRFVRIWPDRLREPRWQSQMQITGREHLAAALAANRSIVLATVHYGSLYEPVHWLRSQGLPVSFMALQYAGEINACRQHLDSLADQANGMVGVPRAFKPLAVRELNRYLHGGGRILAVAMEGLEVKPHIVHCEDFSIRLAPGVLRIAAMANAVVVPCIAHVGRNFSIHMYFGEPVPEQLIQSRDDHHEAMEHIMGEISPWIVADPAQCAPQLIAAMHFKKDPRSITDVAGKPPVKVDSAVDRAEA